MAASSADRLLPLLLPLPSAPLLLPLPPVGSAASAIAGAALAAEDSDVTSAARAVASVRAAARSASRTATRAARESFASAASFRAASCA